MNKKSGNHQENPYKILYWLGAGLLILAIGVIAVVRLAPHKAGPLADPERTMVWMYDDAAPAGPAQVIIMEESPSRGRLAVVPFAAPPDLLQAYGGSHSIQAQRQLASLVGRRIDHRVFLPYSVVATLVDGAQGVTVNGRTMTGRDAVDFIRSGDNAAPDRAARVMVALAQAVNQRGVDLSTSQMLRLARQVDTDIDLTVIPDVLARWSAYAAPAIAPPAAGDMSAVQKLLLPDAR